MFTDSVSALRGTGSGVDICGARTYSIASAVNSASFALHSTELLINSATGAISLYTANKLTVGTHTATVTVGL